MIDTEFENYFEDIKSRKPLSISMKIRKMLLFSVSIEYHPCNRTKKKTYQLFVHSCNIFPVIDLNEHINTIIYLLRNFSDVYA